LDLFHSNFWAQSHIGTFEPYIDMQVRKKLKNLMNKKAYFLISDFFGFLSITPFKTIPTPAILAQIGIFSWTICYWSGLISSHKRTKNKKKTFDTIFGSYLFTKGNKKWGVPEMQDCSFWHNYKKSKK
jgi:hypothetical protein